MSNFLEQAQVAAQHKDWSLVSQCLQQLLSADESGPSKRSGAPPQALDEGIFSLALDVLSAGDFQARWEIAKILPKLGSGAIVPLVELVQDEDADFEARWFAIRTLGEFDFQKIAIDPDTSSNTLRTVVMALVELLKDPDADEDLSEMAAATLANLGPAAVDALSTLLAEPTSRLLAVRALAQIRHSKTIDALLQVVADPELAVRGTALEALSSFHDPRIPPVLVQALQDPAAAMRREAVIGLGLRSDLLNEQDLVALLQPLLWDLNLEVCQQAAIALGRLATEAAVTVLAEVLHAAHTPTPLQIEIVRALGWTGKPAALINLQQALQSASPEVAQEIVVVLGRLEDPSLKHQAAEILITWSQGALPTLSSQVKQAIALSLGQLENPKALELLINLLADPEFSVKLHAIAALKQLDSQLAYHRLQELAQANDLAPDLQHGIAIALQEWQS